MLFQLLLLVTSLTIFLSLTPLVVALLLIVFSVIISMFCWTATSKWLGVSVFFIFVGGMMVVFLYVSSISMNAKLLTNFPPKAILLSFVFILSNSTQSVSLVTSPCFFFESTNFFLISFLVIYLLVALFATSKLTESFKGALIEKF